ncbi:MAG TPA: hypothetical protein VF427_11040 [Noviherbaspirillum sp.]
MKTTTLLLLAFGFASQTALAQLRPPPDLAPDSHTPSGAAQPQPRSPSSDTPSATGSDTSGSSPAGGSGAAGTSSGTMRDSSGSSDTPAGTSTDSSSPSGMQSEAGVELRPAPPVSRLEPKVQGDVTYLCGGVGKEEADYMKKQARAYDMMLTFATRDGGYLADVNVDIKDAKGNDVLQANCDSPMLLIDLPKSGTYRIHADAAGYTLDRTARVQVKQKKGSSVASAVWMVWPQRVAAAPAAAGTASGGSGEGNSSSGGER